MEKRLVILLTILLTGCSNTKHAACVFEQENKQINIDIDAVNDDIDSIRVRTVFKLPNSVLLNENYKKDIDKQLDGNFHYEDELLINEYDVELREIYSLSSTLTYLRKEKFYCE